jgi:hypothetical protein
MSPHPAELTRTDNSGALGRQVEHRHNRVTGKDDLGGSSVVPAIRPTLRIRPENGRRKGGSSQMGKTSPIASAGTAHPGKCGTPVAVSAGRTIAASTISPASES